MAIGFYPYTSLIGGGAGALDGQDGAALADGDAAMVITDAGVYWYHLNATSAAAENSPFRISPDANAGNKRWHLVGTTAVIGAQVKLTSNETIVNATYTYIPWDAEVYDVGGFWAIGNPTKLTIPIGISKVVIAGGIQWAVNSAGRRSIDIRKNDGLFDGFPKAEYHANNNSAITITSRAVGVAATDYFEMKVYQDAGALDLSSGVCWFSIQAVEFA